MKSIVVTVADHALGRMDTLIEELRGRGMQIKNVLRKLGIISGKASNIANLKNIDGVLNIEEETIHMLPPRQSKIQ
jgi:hypothetical protein